MTYDVAGRDPSPKHSVTVTDFDHQSVLKLDVARCEVRHVAPTGTQ